MKKSTLKLYKICNLHKYNIKGQDFVSQDSDITLLLNRLYIPFVCDGKYYMMHIAICVFYKTREISWIKRCNIIWAEAIEGTNSSYICICTDINNIL